MRELRQKNLREYSGFTFTPSSWSEVTISEICQLGRGRVISQEEINKSPGPFPVFSSQTRNDGRMGRISTYDFSGDYVTWTTDGENAGTVFFRSGKFNCTNVCGTLLPKENDRVDARFLAYHLNRVAKRYVSYIGNPKLMNGVMASIGLALPPVKIQARISAVLQAVDQAIEKTEALIEKYQQIKAGLMHDLFTRGIGPDGKLRPPREQAPELYQQTPIGWIPKEWIADDFGVNVEVIDPNPSHRYPPEVDIGYPICSTENFEGEDGFNLDKSKRVPESTFQAQYIRCQFKPVDVVFARKGKIGMARRYGSEDKVFSHTVVLMKPKSHSTDPLWLLWLARSYWFLGGIEVTMNTNSGVPTLGVEFIKSILVPFPQPEEQRLMARKLDLAALRVAIEVQRKEKLSKQKTGLMHDLLTGKVQVNSDPPETSHVQ